MNQIKLYKSPLKGLKLIGLSSVLVLPSLYILLTKDNPEFIFWICVCFFGLGYVIGFINIFDRRAQVIINKNGIWDRSLKMEEISWNDIYNAHLINIHDQKFIALKTSDKISNLKELNEWSASLNEMVGAEKININISGIWVNANNLVAIIKQLPYETPENRNKLISEFTSK